MEIGPFIVDFTYSKYLKVVIFNSYYFKLPEGMGCEWI